MAVGLSALANRARGRSTRTTGFVTLHPASRDRRGDKPVLFVWIELTIEKPLIRLRLLTQRNFGFGVIAMTMSASRCRIGVHPAGLSRQAQGYNAEQIGAVLAWTACPS